MLNTIFGLILAAAIILLAVTAVLVVHGMRRNASFLSCTGTIIGFYENSAEGRVGSYENTAISPVVEYKVNGTRYEMIGKYYSTSMKVGGTVEVLYSEEDPSVASIKTGLFFAPIVTGALAAAFLLLYIVFCIVKNKGIL